MHYGNKKCATLGINTVMFKAVHATVPLLMPEPRATDMGGVLRAYLIDPSQPLYRFQIASQSA